jgi:cytidine deaminase
MSPIINRAIKKANQSVCKFKVSAIGFNNKGEMIGSITNAPRFSRYGGGLHAEALLIKRYGKKLKTILICRVNSNGKLLPIDPCLNCQKLAIKFGIKIMSVKE